MLSLYIAVDSQEGHNGTVSGSVNDQISIILWHCPRGLTATTVAQGFYDMGWGHATLKDFRFETTSPTAVQVVKLL